MTREDDTISRTAAIRWVKTECNPYGNPTLDFESGKKVIKHLEQMPPAQLETCAYWDRESNICALHRSFVQPDCSDCIEHGGDWDCDHVHCHKGKFTQPEILACGEGELNVPDTNTRDINQKGEWKECGIITIEGYRASLKKCSKCHSEIIGGGNFCPVCGADMRGKNNG